MADTGQKSQEIKSEPTTSSADGEADLSVELSLEELDSFLAKEDPEFAKSVTEIGQDTSLSIKEIILSDEDQELADEISLWEGSSGLRGRIFRFLPGIVRVSLKYKKFRFWVFSIVTGVLVRVRNLAFFLIANGKRFFIGAIHQIVKSLKNYIASAGSNFRAFSRIKKIFSMLLVFSTFATFLFIYRSVTKGVIPESEVIFIPSLETIATEIYDYDPKTESESFYDNLRATQNLLLLPRMVVNLKRSTPDQPLPMLALELFIEGHNPEVIVEVKDREAAVKDSIQRSLEEFSFQELDSPEGKRAMCEKIKKLINSLLTSGSIRRVLIKTIVLKP